MTCCCVDDVKLSGSFPFSANSRAKAVGDTEGMVKILTHTVLATVFVSGDTCGGGRGMTVFWGFTSSDLELGR